MEFTVSKTDLVRELSLSQGVVEKKTTIPILSNVLVETQGDRIHLTATDLELGIRSSCPARVRRGTNLKRAARCALSWLAGSLPNKIIAARITFLACANRAVGRYAAADVQLHCPGAAGLDRSHYQLALRPDSSVDLIA